MVRKLAMVLSKADPPFVESQISSSKKIDRTGKQRTITQTRYRLTEKNFVRWPRTAVFLMECRRFPRDENGTMGKEEFADHLKINHGISEAEFNEDWDYIMPRQYVHEYGSRFSTGLRIEAESEWLELLAQDYKRKD